MSMGSSKSGSSTSTSSDSISFGTAVNSQQMPFLNQMWQQGQNLGNAGQGIGMAGYNNANQSLGGPRMRQAFNTMGRLQNPDTDPMMGVYARQLGQNFNEQIMPGLRSQGIQAGGYGGSRQGIAEGLAGSRMGQQLQDFGAQLYGQNQDRALQAAGGAGQLAGNQSQGYLQNAAFGMGVPWYALNQQQGLLGQPIIENLGAISRSGGTGTSRASGFGLGL